MRIHADPDLKHCCKDKIVLGKTPTPCSVSLREVLLHAVLFTLGFSENLIVDSAQC